MREVAEQLACDSSNMTGITDRLEERGLVQRTADPADRRVRLLVLTEEGKRVRAEVVDRMSRPPELIEALSDRDLATLRRILLQRHWTRPTRIRRGRRRSSFCGSLAQPTQLAAELLDPGFHLQHGLDPGQIESLLGGQLLDPAQPFDVSLGVEAGVFRRALRGDQPPRLVGA